MLFDTFFAQRASKSLLLDMTNDNQPLAEKKEAKTGREIKKARSAACQNFIPIEGILKNDVRGKLFIRHYIFYVSATLFSSITSEL